MKNDKIISVFTGTKEEIINGQTVTVKTYKSIDLDQTLDFDALINDVTTTDKVRNAEAAQKIRLYQKMQALAARVVTDEV